MLISTDEKKHLKKIQHPFVIKTLKLEIEENYLNIMKVIMKSTQLTLDSKVNTEALPLRSGTR